MFDIATGAAHEVNGDIVEDASWLRPVQDKRHINIAELDAAIKGLALATKWSIKLITLATDSKTVASWLKQLVNNVQQIKTGRLQEVLIRRRLQIFEDIIATTGFAVEIKWVPLQVNRADALTRIPSIWQRRRKSDDRGVDITAASLGLSVVRPVTCEQIAEEQQADPIVHAAVQKIMSDRTDEIYGLFRQMRDQLLVEDGVLKRSTKLPVEGLVSVPVIPSTLQSSVIKTAHVNSGHANWETMYTMLRSRCWFPGMASKCQEHVQFARKKGRQTGREVRKKRRELRDGVYPTNLPAQNDAHQTQE